MNERRYLISEGLLRKLAEFAKVLSGIYHAAARGKFWGAKRLRQLADEADASAEEVKLEMRKQDGKE